ncbi:MAG TPA: hypothetical protein VIM77_14950 [Mucilaginibacter sp.]
MKTKLTLIKTLGFVAVILVAVFAACKKEAASGEIEITGKWAKVLFKGIQQYEFKNGNQFEFDIIAADSVTKKVLGYSYKYTGTYSIKNNSLTIVNMAAYINSKNSYGPVTELVPVNTPQSTINYTVSLNNKKNKLSLYFTCPPNADCVPSPIVFDKQ